MIRIDEIYTSVFRSWFDRYHPNTRLYYCDPFGRSDPDSIISYGENNSASNNYTFFFDQEPIDLARHHNTFQKVIDLNYHLPQSRVNHLITSEMNSDTVDYVAHNMDCRSHYYFFHGWAALDWYRGYHRTFLITEPKDRVISKTFIAPNRIVAGQRQHRLLTLYHLFKNQLNNNWISCPEICPAEKISVYQACESLTSIYPDIQDVFTQAQLPRCFPNETDHPMHSYCLSLFDQCQESLLYLVTETVAQGRRWHLTEKTFKPICLRMPFVLVGTHGSLEYLRRYGFKTFESLWSEDYDLEVNDVKRIEQIASLLKNLDSLDASEKQKIYQHALPIVEHNYQHFYGGGFEKILWNELTDMFRNFDV